MDQLFEKSDFSSITRTLISQISAFCLIKHLSKSARAKTRGRPNLSASIAVAGIGADVRVSDDVQAPIETADLQARLREISDLIKEVTWGGLQSIFKPSIPFHFLQ